MTAISWADRAHNAIDGCTPKGPECDHCYAARLAGTRHRHLTTTDGVRGDLMTIGKTRDLGDGKRLPRYIYNGRVSLNVAKLAKALKIPKNGGMRYPRKTVTETALDDNGKSSTWTREVADRTKPKEPVGNRVFWNHMSDTFHESLTNEEIAAQFAVFAARPDLRFMVLTKRPERALAWFEWMASYAPDMGGTGPMRALCDVFTDYRCPFAGWIDKQLGDADDIPDSWIDRWPLPNVAIGVSAGTQRMVDERLPLLLRVPSVMRFWSAEPLLESVSVPLEYLAPFFDLTPNLERTPRIDQVIIGAESGHGRRPCDLAWIQDLATQVLDSQQRIGDIWTGGTALYIKQADVCDACKGRGEFTADALCVACGGEWAANGRKVKGSGQNGKIQKLPPPTIHVPGHGAQQWTQAPKGWAK